MQEPNNIGKVISGEITSDALPHLRELLLKHMILVLAQKIRLHDALGKKDLPKGSQSRFDQVQHLLKELRNFSNSTQ